MHGTHIAVKSEINFEVPAYVPHTHRCPSQNSLQPGLPTRCSNSACEECERPYLNNEFHSIAYTYMNR